MGVGCGVWPGVWGAPQQAGGGQVGCGSGGKGRVRGRACVQPRQCRPGPTHCGRPFPAAWCRRGAGGRALPRHPPQPPFCMPFQAHTSCSPLEPIGRRPPCLIPDPPLTHQVRGFGRVIGYEQAAGHLQRARQAGVCRGGCGGCSLAARRFPCCRATRSPSPPPPQDSSLQLPVVARSSAGPLGAPCNPTWGHYTASPPPKKTRTHLQHGLPCLHGPLRQEPTQRRRCTTRQRRSEQGGRSAALQAPLPAPAVRHATARVREVFE